MTKQIEAIIDRRAKDKGHGKVTHLYAEIETMQHFNYDPFTWSNLHRWDRRMLRYQLLVKNHREHEVFEKMKQEQERKKQFRDSLPAQQMPFRRR